MGIRSNIFLCKRTFDDPSLTVDIYCVEGIANDKDRFWNLSKVKEMLARRLNTLVVLYSPGELDYAVVFQPQSTVEIKEQKLSVRLEKKSVSLVNYPQQLRELHYEATRSSLEKYGLARHAYNKYFEHFPEKTIDDFEIYRGMWFRYDLFGNYVQLAIDPITSVTSRSTVWDLISRYGREEAKKRLAYRNVLATQEKGKAIYQIVRLDFSKTVNTKCIPIGDKLYSVKEYFKRPGGKPELADLISDEECVVFVKRGYEGKELSMAPSLLKLVHKTDDFPREPTLRQELTSEVYLSCERRRVLTQKFLTILNPLWLGKLSVEFETADLSDLNRDAGVLAAPKLVFGNKQAVTPDFSNYGMFMKNTLRSFGPARKAAFSSNVLLLVYPSTVARGKMKNFYEDCKAVSREFFRTNLPDKPTSYSYPDFDVRREYESFKNTIDAVLAVMQNEGETTRYLNFKEWFDKPNQVITYRVIDERYQLRRGKYQNLLLNVCAGLLGKMGGRPWILDKKLSADFYVGLDVGGDKNARVACYTFFDGYGNYVREEWRPQRAEEINTQELKRIVANTIASYGSPVNNIVFHRDGQFTDGELQGIDALKSELLSNGAVTSDIKITCVNIKKSVPYRLYDSQGKQQSACKIGSYLVLDDHSGIVANSGAPLLRQGMARPILVETVPPFDNTDIKTALEDIYYLSFMHWGSITVKMKLPATLRYADALTPFALRSIRITGVPL
ncbi:MAG: Piwi domain-containing protein [Candidatus Bathyarchaeia archaeon]